MPFADWIQKSIIPPPHAVIRKKAHAMTLGFIALIVPSICAIYFKRAGIREDEPYWIWMAHSIWTAHIAFAAISLILWIVEKPKLTKYEVD